MPLCDVNYFLNVQRQRSRVDRIHYEGLFEEFYFRRTFAVLCALILVFVLSAIRTQIGFS